MMNISGSVRCVNMQPAACWPLFNAPVVMTRRINNSYLFSHFNFQMSLVQAVASLSVNCVADAGRMRRGSILCHLNNATS